MAALFSHILPQPIHLAQKTTHFLKPPLFRTAELLAFFARLRGVPEAAVAAASRPLLSRLGLAPIADRPAGQYSGGNRRRLSVGAALVGAPPVVLLDEPSTGMVRCARVLSVCAADRQAFSRASAPVVSSLSVVSHHPAPLRPLLLTAITNRTPPRAARCGLSSAPRSPAAAAVMAAAMAAAAVAAAAMAAVVGIARAASC